VRNADVRLETPIHKLLVHNFWGQELWPESGGWTHKSYRPLTMLTYRWQLLADRNAMGAQVLRFGNCVLHSTNSALLSYWLHLFHLPTAWLYVGSAIFALHPVHLENLPYIVGRADSLATLFLLIALILRRANALRASSGCLSAWLAAEGAIVSCAVLAGLSKETGFMLPLVLSCLALFEGAACRSLADLLWFSSLAAFRVWFVGGTEVGFSFVDTPVRYSESLLTRSLSYLYQHAVYAQLLLLPWNQSWDYSYDALPLLRHWDDVRLLAILVALLTICALASLAARRGAALC